MVPKWSTKHHRHSKTIFCHKDMISQTQFKNGIWKMLYFCLVLMLYAYNIFLHGSWHKAPYKNYTSITLFFWNTPVKYVFAYFYYLDDWFPVMGVNYTAGILSKKNMKCSNNGALVWPTVALYIPGHHVRSYISILPP